MPNGSLAFQFRSNNASLLATKFVIVVIIPPAPPRSYKATDELPADWHLQQFSIPADNKRPNTDGQQEK
jgi:hypothetical protein